MWLARVVRDDEVAGSSPVSPTERRSKQDEKFIPLSGKSCLSDKHHHSYLRALSAEIVFARRAG